jgi:hypothetical protein
MNPRAKRGMALLALLGMLGCASGGGPRATPDDARVDAVWAALQRGALPEAEAHAAGIEDELLRRRAQRDVLAAREGRGAAYVACLAEGDWLAARFEASGERALQRLRVARRADDAPAALWIEEARRSPTTARALSAARAAEELAPGGVEGLCLEVELLYALGRADDAEERLDTGVDSARLRLARARLLAGTGRLDATARSLMQDIEDGRAVPASLLLLQDILVAVPSAELEAAARATLDRASFAGPRMLRARDRLAARLAFAAGVLPAAVAQLEAVDPRAPEDDAALERWRARLALGAAPAVPLELRIDADPERPRSPELLARRLADEWDLAARASYEEADEGDGKDLDGFVAALDEAAAGLPGAPSLAALPRRDFGLFGEMLDTAPLRALLPDAVVLCGQALTLPAEIAWFDRRACTTRDLPDGAGSYEQCLVRRQRVTGYAAAHGATITGAGIDPLVWIDLDQLDREQRSRQLQPVGPPLEALPAAGREQRLDLSEPLDVARWMDDVVRAQSGERYAALLLDSLAQHEQQHIVDFRLFAGAGAGGKLALLFSGGLLPGSVRAEIERRAQLRALRTAEDPRIALAHAVAHLPVEGPDRDEPHAAGYAALVAEFVRRLDAADWPGARTPSELGLDPGRVLVQQLQRLDAATVRAIALAMDD